MTYDSMLVHCCVMFAVMGGIALLLFRRRLLPHQKRVLGVAITVPMSRVQPSDDTNVSGRSPATGSLRPGAISPLSAFTGSFSISLSASPPFLRSICARDRRQSGRFPRESLPPWALAACAPFLLLGFRGILLYHAGATDSQVEIVSGHFVGSVSGPGVWLHELRYLPLPAFHVRAPSARVGNWPWCSFPDRVRLRHDTLARFSMVVLPLAMLLYMTIRKGRRWPSMPAAGLIAASVALLVARGHSALGDMSSQERTISAVGRRAAELIARGDDTALLPSLYRYSDLVR